MKLPNSRGHPTGHARPLTREPRVRKRLFSPVAKPERYSTERSSLTVDVWNDDENKAFVLLHCATQIWPSHGKASKFVNAIKKA